MAVVANRSQAVRTGVGSPVAVHSRVIGCYTGIAPAIAQTMCYTAGVGQRLVLLNVSVETFISERAPMPDLRFWVKRGYARPQTVAQLAAWENVIPIWFGDDVHGMPVPWRGCCWSWDMAVRYEGAGQRFGLVVDNTSGETGLIAVTFRIAEY